MTIYELAINALSWVFILSGSVFVLIGSIGILRFPDFWARLHAASIADSAGVILLMVGMCLQAGASLVTVKLIIIAIFLFITGPTATHAIANAALVTGLRPKEAPGMVGEEPEERVANAKDRTSIDG